MFLGIESGGTKLQLGVGRGDGTPLMALERFTIDPAAQNTGILRQIEAAAPALIARHQVTGIGVGFRWTGRLVGRPADQEPSDRRLGRF